VYVQAVSSRKDITEAALAKKKIQIIEGRFLDKAPETRYSDAKKAFLAWAEINTASGSYHMYKNGLDKWDKECRYLTLDRIGPDILERHKAALLREGKVSPRTINRDTQAIKRLCSWATEQNPKLLERSAIQAVRLLDENNERARFLSDDEIVRLLSECDTPHLRMAVIIALETGLRKEGCLTLQWRNIDFENKLITKPHTKGNKTVHIPLTDTLKAELDAYKKSCSVLSRWVIPSPKNPAEPMGDNANFGFNTACVRAGIRNKKEKGDKRRDPDNFVFHDLRHTFASLFLMRGGDISTLARILGHSTTRMTERYGHIADSHMKAQMEKFDKGRKR
jgi:integrase